jgi:Tol biopolymer transport system component
VALHSGTRLGSYQIVAQIGVGGMGEVYRATDTNLGRDVAIKVLPDGFTQDAERLARFEREARTLASLNHPNVAIIHGVEKAAGSFALVMELVEGPTLADRIREGAIPVDEALPIAKEIAEALEAAHEQGIIHRDLKPANVKIRPDGKVKVLDFGLAKTLEPVSATSGSLSPTITSPAMTQAGMILGTAAYMSPEQAKGRAADRRSDIWAFGCVLYEMLTGTRPFDGEDVADTLAAILRGQPDWTRLPHDTPPAVVAFIKRSLEKDRRRRIGDIAAALFVLSEPWQTSTGIRREPSRAFARYPVAAIAAAAIAAVGIVAVAWWIGVRSVASEPKLVARFEIPLLRGNEQFAFLGGKVVALSPDGKHLAYLTTRRMNVRSLDRVEPLTLRIHDTTLPDNIRNVFFSPDSQWIGFWQDGQISKIGVGGGTPVTIAATRNPSAFSWESDGTIVFAQQGEILRVAEAGGTPEVLVRDLKGRVQSLQLLPGNRSILFTLFPAGTTTGAEINVRSLDTGEQRTVLRNGVDARYVTTGHLVYFDAGALLAVPFDLRALAVSGAPVPVAEAVASSSAVGQTVNAAHFAISRAGTLAYVRDGLNVSTTRTMVWVDRAGKEEPLGAEERAYVYPRLSPDGSSIALTLADQDRDIWIFDIGRRRLRRLTADPAAERYSVWTPDGKRIAFGSNRDGQAGTWWQAADGSGVPERLAGMPLSRFNNLFPTTISPDGSMLVAMAMGPGAARDVGSGSDLWLLRLKGDPQPAGLLQTNSAERNAEISPNGRWIAYEAAEGNQANVWVRPFPEVNGGNWPVSNGGGSQPLWSRDGKELFFIDASGVLMSVTVEGQSPLVFGTPEKVLTNSYLWSIPTFSGRQYDISPDGKRFLMLKGTNESTTAGSVTIVQNWFEELKRLVPVK